MLNVMTKVATSAADAAGMMLSCLDEARSADSALIVVHTDGEVCSVVLRHIGMGNTYQNRLAQLRAALPQLNIRFVPHPSGPITALGSIRAQDYMIVERAVRGLN